MGWNISSIVFWSRVWAYIKVGFPLLLLSAYSMVAFLGEDDSGHIPRCISSIWCSVGKSLQAWLMPSVLYFRYYPIRETDVCTYGQVWLLECHNSQVLWVLICRCCPELHCGDSVSSVKLSVVVPERRQAGAFHSSKKLVGWVAKLAALARISLELGLMGVYSARTAPPLLVHLFPTPFLIT